MLQNHRSYVADNSTVAHRLVSGMNFIIEIYNESVKRTSHIFYHRYKHHYNDIRNKYKTSRIRYFKMDKL